MTRCTSKASLLDEKEKGHLISQEERVLEIMAIGGTFSRQEILALYRGKHGEIEYTSISRCCTNLKDSKQIFEVGTRKCSVTDKVINELSLTNCNHDRYRKADYMCHPKALKDPDIAWIGKVVQNCQDCGADISYAKRAPVLSASEYLRMVGK